MDSGFRSKSFISLFFPTLLLYLNSAKPAQALIDIARIINSVSDI